MFPFSSFIANSIISDESHSFGFGFSGISVE